MQLNQAIHDPQALVRSWGLSEAAAELLVEEPDILQDLQQARSLPAFPAGHQPTVVEELFHDLTYRRWHNGKLVYERACDPDYDPPFVEYRFDEECALFHINGEIVVNRIENIALSVFVGEAVSFVDPQED